jgi:hypothetical protein
MTEREPDAQALALAKTLLEGSPVVMRDGRGEFARPDGYLLAAHDAVELMPRNDGVIDGSRLSALIAEASEGHPISRYTLEIIAKLHFQEDRPLPTLLARFVEISFAEPIKTMKRAPGKSAVRIDDDVIQPYVGWVVAEVARQTGVKEINSDPPKWRIGRENDAIDAVREALLSLGCRKTRDWVKGSLGEYRYALSEPVASGSETNA